MIEDWKEDINDFIDEADACLKEVEESLELFDDMKYSRARAKHLLENFDSVLPPERVAEMTREDFDMFFVQYVTPDRHR